MTNIKVISKHLGMTGKGMGFRTAVTYPKNFKGRVDRDDKDI
jgi:hypothetical protein